MKGQVILAVSPIATGRRIACINKQAAKQILTEADTKLRAAIAVIPLSTG
jgi:hypothetical protein